MQQPVRVPPPGVAGWSAAAAAQTLGPPDGRAIVSCAAGEQTVVISHQELRELVSTAAAALQRSGLSAGGLAGIALASDSIYTTVYQLAAWQVGAAVVHLPLRPKVPRAQLVSALENVRVVVATPATARDVQPALPTRTVVLIPNELPSRPVSTSGAEAGCPGGVGHSVDSVDSVDSSDSDESDDSSSSSSSSSSSDDDDDDDERHRENEEDMDAGAQSIVSSFVHDDGCCDHEEQDQRGGSDLKRPAEDTRASEREGAASKRFRSTTAELETVPSDECVGETTTTGPLMPLPTCAAEAEAVVTQVRKSRLLGTERRTDVPKDVQIGIAAAKRTMQAALARLSSDLYSQNCRWILELLQNADDNDYLADLGALDSDEAPSDTAAVQLPAVDISVTESHLVLINNERGFTASDVEALCDIGASTKLAETKRKRCIGEKGIGFKSVFAVSNTPYVRSNYFSFRFEKDSAEGIGSLVPHWVNPSSFPCVDAAGGTVTATPYPGTCILLPFHNQTDNSVLAHATVWKTMSSLESIVLLFLRQLRMLTVCMPRRVDKNSEVDDSRVSSHKCHRRIIRKEGVVPDILIRDTRFSDATPTESIFKFKVVQYKAPVPAKLIDSTPRRCQRNSTTEIACAFPLARDGSADASTIQKVFAFLPTRTYGLRFSLQAEFSLPSSREEVLRDSSWNQWIAQEAFVDAFIAAVGKTFLKADQRLRTSWYRYIPRRSDLVDKFFHHAHARILGQLKKMKCIATDNESGFRRPGEIVLRTDPQLERILPNDLLRAALNMEYAAQGTDDGCDGKTLMLLGCSKLSHKMLLRCMKHRAFVTEMRSKDDAWILSLYAVLARHSSSSKWLSVMQQLPLVRLVNGSLCCPLREAGYGPDHDGSVDTRLVFLPSAELDKWMLSPSLNIVRPATIYSGDSLSGVAMTSISIEQDNPVVHLLLKLGVCPATPVAVIQRYILPHHKRFRTPNLKISYEDALILCVQVSYVKTHMQLFLNEGDNSESRMQELRDTLLLRSYNPLLAQPHHAAVASSIFMEASRLYISGTYTGLDQPSLESVFCDDPEIRIVDPCYLGARPPGLTEDTSNEPQKRRAAWTSFLQHLGCRVAPELIKKEVLLSPSVASKRFSVRPRGNVAVCDHVLSPEFRRMLASDRHESLGALLALMDRRWTESYSHRQHCVIEYHQQRGGMKRVDRVPASFVQELRQLLRVPTSHGLLPLSQVFCRTPELIQLFGEQSIPFLMPHLELSSLEMKHALGLSGELTTELALAVLRCERSRSLTVSSLPEGSNGVISKARAAYEILRMRFEHEGSQIRQAFAAEPLIAVPSDATPASIRFLLPTQVCWHGDENVFGTQHGFLEMHYVGLESFFCAQLGVCKRLLMRDLADRLVELSMAHHAGVSSETGSDATLGAVRSLVLELYQRLSQWIGFASDMPHGHECIGRLQWPPPEPLDWQCLEQLRSQPIFLTQHGTFCHAEAAIAPDDAELQTLFSAPSEGANLLAITAFQAVQLSPLLRFFGIKYLSSAVVTAPRFAMDEVSSPRSEEWTGKVVACLLPIAQYIHHRHPEQMIDFQQSGVLGRLAQTLSVHTVQQPGSLQVCYELPAGSSTVATVSCLATRAALAIYMPDQRFALVIDATTVRNDLDQLASELLGLLTNRTSACADPELTNFTELLLSKPSTRAIDRMMLHRKIPLLTTEMAAGLGLSRVAFTEPVLLSPANCSTASTALIPTVQSAQADGKDVGSSCDDSDDPVETDCCEEETTFVARPVAAVHRENAVARQAHQGKAAELRCAKEEASRLWPWICKGQSEPWRSLTAEFQRINQLGARGGSGDLVDVRRPGSEAALATRLHVAAVAEGIGYDVLSAEHTADQSTKAPVRLVRIEVKSCAARRSPSTTPMNYDGTNHAVSPTTHGLTFYMSEAERKMAAIYLRSQAFRSDAWKLQMYAPPADLPPRSDGRGASVDDMVPIDLTNDVAKEIIRAGPRGERAHTRSLRATEWCFTF